MGLFTPKISNTQMQFVRSTLNQLNDSGNLVNSTIKPDVFFGRLNFTLDLLLRLQQYEKYKIYHTGSPTKDYQKLLTNLDTTVNTFIDRAVGASQRKISGLKTEKAKRKNYQDFTSALISAFDCSHTFWLGDRGFPHYNGPLFTDQNYRRVQAIYDASCSEL